MRAANALKHRAPQNHGFGDDDTGMMSSINDLIDCDNVVLASNSGNNSSSNNNVNNNSFNKLQSGGGGGGGASQRPSKSVVAGSSPPKPTPPANSSSASQLFPIGPRPAAVSSSANGASTASNPKLTIHILDGLKNIETEFANDLGTDWWARSASLDTSHSSGAETMGARTGTKLTLSSMDCSTLTPSASTDYSSSNIVSANNSSLADCDDHNNNSNNNNIQQNHEGSQPPPCGGAAHHNNHQQQQQQQPRSESHQFAADGSDKTQDVIKKLEKLSHSALLTYAARISILLGNFYRLAQEGGVGGDNTAGSFRTGSHSPQSKNLAGLGAQSARSDDGGNDQGLIDFYSYTSRPESQMTTFSDAPIGFSASTMSLAHLPSAATNNKVEVSGDLDEGTKTINDYVIVAPIGSGSQGTVELGVTLAGEPRAIKALKRSALMKQNEAAIRREVAIMKKLRHDNVVRLFEVIDDPNANMIYLVMKYCSNGPLVHIRPDFTCDTLPLAVAKSLLRQLLSGLHYLHLRRIVHRDIKPDNILLDHANVPCFVDFGVSGTVHKKSRTTTTSQGTAEGTPAFWAPELFVRKRDEQKRLAGTPGKDGVPLFPAPPVDLMASDVYSLGATFFAAIIGKTPFPCDSAEKLEEAVINDPLQFPNHLPSTWKDLFMKMMDKDPQRRAKIPTLKLHPVFTDDGQDPGSPVDDVRVSDSDIHGAVTKLKGKSGFENNNNNNNGDAKRGFGPSGSVSQQNALGSDDDDDGLLEEDQQHQQPRDEDGTYVASTPRGQNNAHNSNRALFHRRVVTGGPTTNKKVAASFSHVGKMDDNNNNGVVVRASSKNPKQDNNRAVSHSPGANFNSNNIENDNNMLLPRSFSTARMPLKNIVRAGGINNNNEYQSQIDSGTGSATARTKLPFLKATTTRPATSGK